MQTDSVHNIFIHQGAFKDNFMVLSFILKGKKYIYWDIESREECDDRKQKRATKRKPYKVHLHLYALKII